MEDKKSDSYLSNHKLELVCPQVIGQEDKPTLASLGRAQSRHYYMQVIRLDAKKG